MWLDLGDAGITFAQNSAGTGGDHTGHSLLALQVDLEAVREVVPARMAVRILKTQHEVGEVSVSRQDSPGAGMSPCHRHSASLNASH